MGSRMSLSTEKERPYDFTNEDVGILNGSNVKGCMLWDSNSFVVLEMFKLQQ